MLTSGVGKEEAEARQTVTDQAGSLKASVSQPWEEEGQISAVHSGQVLAVAAGRGCVQLGWAVRGQ